MNQHISPIKRSLYLECPVKVKPPHHGRLNVKYHPNTTWNRLSDWTQKKTRIEDTWNGDILIG